MNKVSKLPDFIDVANIRDLFWNNNSDLYPACVPTGYHRVEGIRPTFLTPYVGTCVLDGELNHCIYNGEYYFLTKLEILDIEKLRYKYQLDYDVMINFMARGVDVRGTLIKTNRTDILEGCLQTTVPILADPIKKHVYGKAVDSKETWQQKLKVDLFSVDTVRKNFEEFTITKENYQSFIRRIETNILGDGTKDKQWLADTVIGGFNEYAHQNPLFILDSLPIDRTFNKWKLLLSYEIAKFFEDTRREDLIITKQTTPSDHFNASGYVIGKKDNTIGQNIVSEVTLSRIDLSGLIDIVPVENTAKRDLEPNRKPTYEMLPHSQRISSPPNIYVLLRKPYLPIGSNSSIDGCISSPADGVKDYCQIGLLAGNNTPQKVVTKADRTGYLWYLNKNNLALIEEDDKGLKSLGCNFSVSTWTGAYARWGFFSAEYKNIAPIGFLIYQVLKRSSEWDDIEHIGEGVTSLFFRTGLCQSAVHKRYVTDVDKYWWGYADQELLQLWGDSELSRTFLDLDQFNWLSIAPSDIGYSYKYHYGNYWNYKKFFPTAGDRQVGYPSTLNRMNIQVNGREVTNPYSYADPDVALSGWLADRERKLDAISIYKQVDIDGGIRKGDILTTSMEHGWYNMDELTRLLFPYDISTAEWIEWSSRDYGGTINLGVDEYAEYRAEQSRITATGAVVVSIGILAVLLAPFTGGGSLAVTAALATPGLVSIGSGASVLASQPSFSTQFKSSVINTLPYSNVRYQVDPDLADGTIVLYLYRGKYRVGVYKKKTTSLTLDDSDDNLIKSVDGVEHRDLDLMLIRPLEHGLLDYKQAQVVSETLKQEIIEFALGNRDNLAPLDKTHYYSPSDLKVGTHTFDLRGTNWYLVMHNGTMNFVPKSTSVFDNIKDEGQLIEIRDKVSTYAKINQKADLNYYGQIFKLNTKFNFDGSFRYISKPIVLEKEYADPDVEYKWLQVKEQNDDIDEILTLPRKETRHAEVVDSSQVLMMKERLLQISSNYEQDKYANELMVGDKRLALARQREDLNWMHTSSSVNIGMKAVGALVGGGLFGKKDSMMAAGAIGLAGSMKSDIEFLLKYPTLMKRVDEDEKNLMLANSQSLYQRKQNYEHDFKFQTLKLNKIAGSYQKAGVSNRDAQEKYNKERGVGDVNVEVFLPSPIQQKQIDHIYSTFGCECISDYFEHTPLTIRDNMPSGIYQFSRIENDGIQASITDTTLREILRRILENGVKFEGCAFQIEPWETKPIAVVLPKRPKIVFDPGNIKDWSIEKWDTYKIKTDRKDIIDTLRKVPHFGLTDEEWNKHKDLFKDIKDDDLLDLISKVIAGREEGETIVVALPKDVDPEKDNLNRTIADLGVKVSELESKLDECRNSEIALRDQLKAKESSVNVVQETVNALSLEKADLLSQIKECKNQVQQLINAQATCDRINTQKIKDLQARIRELEADMEANNADLIKVTKDLEDERTAKEKLQKMYDQVRDERDRLQKSYDDERKRLEDEVHKHKVDKEDLTQQLNDERIKVINERDEVNRLKKQLEESKGDRDKIAELEQRIQEIELEKASADERIAAKQRELEQCRTDLEIAKKALPKKEYKPQVRDECALWKSIVNYPYTYDVKARDNGWNAFLDLVFGLAQDLRWEGKTELDRKLMNNVDIRHVLELLEELKNIPIIDKAIDVMNEPGWPKYLSWLTNGGDLNGSVDAVISKVNTIKGMETKPTIHAVKALLDELNWQSYKAMEVLKDQIKTDQDLQTLFTHIYPGKTIELYKAVYGDSKWAIIRKRFTEELKCNGEGGGSMVEWADHYRNTTKYDTSDIPKPVKPNGGESDKLPGKVDVQPHEVQIRIKKNLIFKPTDNLSYREIRNLIPNFNNAVRGTRATDKKWDWTWEIVNYVYSRYMKLDGYPWYEGTPSGDYYKMVWVRQKALTRTQSNRYFRITAFDFDVDKAIRLVEEYWGRRNEINFNRSFIEGVKSGNIKVNIYGYTLPTLMYTTAHFSYDLPTDMVDDLVGLGLLEDFLKICYILSRCSLHAVYRGHDYSDNYYVFELVGFNSESIDLSPNITDNTHFFIGWLFPAECVYDTINKRWRDVYGSGTQDIRFNSDNVLYQFVRWFYEVATGTREFKHPWKIGGGGAYEFLKGLYLAGH